MNSPDWYIDLSNTLENYFNQNPKAKNVSGEQFLRNYLIENPLEDYTEEDEDKIVEEHLEPIQRYLDGKGWVKIDFDSLRWLSAEANPQKRSSKASSAKCDIARLDALLNQVEDIKVGDLEWIKQELLIEGCGYQNIEALKYKLAKEISKHDRYTQDEKAEAFYQAALNTISSQKAVECLESASNFKANQYKFDEAAAYLEKAVYKLDPSLKPEVKGLIKGFLSLTKRRFNLTFKKKNSKIHEQTLRIIRKARLYYEQAGIRHKSSHLFVLETDIDKRGKCFFSQIVIFLYWLFAKYGESPTRVLASSIIIILIWACFYSSMGLMYNLDETGGQAGEFATNIYFSIVTFTTLGYGDFSPIYDARIIASIQAMLGLFMTSLFLVTFVRRYSR